MQNKYYYLIASLPYLDYNIEAPTTTKLFLFDCEGKLTQKDLLLLKLAKLESIASKEGAPQALKSWHEFNFHLKDQLAAMRQGHKAPTRQHMPQEIKDIFDQPNPLEMENRIQEKMWGFINTMEYKYNFDLNWLICYFLKLQILERKGSFNKKKGEESFSKLTEVSYE